MNRIRTTTILFVVLAFAFYAISPAIAKVSKREARKFIKQVESEHQVSFKQMKDQMSAAHEIWVQPENKDVECKVVSVVEDESDIRNVKFYWDGECKDGYAAGLGRAFQDSTNGLFAWLEEYGEPGKLPIDYYRHGYDAKDTTIGFNDGSEINPWGFNGSRYQFSENISNKNFLMSEFYFDPETGYAFLSLFDPSFDVVTRSIIYTSRKQFRIQTFLSPANPTSRLGQFTNEKGTPIGYGIAIMRNGEVMHIEYKNGSQSKTKLPSELVERFVSLERDINEKLTLVRSNIQKGDLALEVYRRRTCSGELNVDYMDNILYGQICLEHGDFTPYIDKIEELQVTAQKRQEANAQIARAQAETNANRQAAAAQQQRAQQAQTSQAIANAAQQSQNFFNNTMNMNAALSRNYSPPSFNFAPIRKRNVSVCHVRSNIVFCN